MKKISFLFFVFFLITSVLVAQTPQYYNFNNGTVSNMFPLNVPSGKLSQTVVPAATFITPSPAPAGNITKLYFRISDTYPLGPATYTTFKILLQHVASEFVTSGSFISGPWDTVFARSSVTLQAAVNTWLEFTLDHPFAYNPAQPLAIAMEQCNATGTTSGYSLRYTTATGQRRHYSVGGCPFVWQGSSTNIINCGIDVVQPSLAPELLYFKFENNPTATSTPNCAFPGVGTNPAPFTNTTLGTGGQFDSCLVGTAVTNGGIATGWNCNFGSGSWTISMWLQATSTTFGYIFGDAGSGSFRCFNNGAAGTNGITLRGTGITNVDVTGFASGPVVVHFVYDSIPHNIKVYKNGVLSATVNQSQLNIATGSGFRVGGYSTSATLNGKIDEFRVYDRALDSSEIAATWNTDLVCGIVTAISNNNNTIPNSYQLYQNYPNPFNPSTRIEFALPKAGNVKLTVFDVLGREIAVLFNGHRTAGNHSVEFDASYLASGVYLYRIEAGEFKDVKKMILIK